MDSIRQIVHALELGSRAAQKSVGLSGAQLFVLQTLAASDGMSVNELARRSYTHQSSVSGVVGRLVEAKLVRRAPSVFDARRVDLTLSPAGRRILQAGFVTPQQRLIAALDRLPPARLSDLRSLLQQVVSFSGIDSGAPPMFLEKRNNASGGRAAAPLRLTRAKTQQ